MGVVLYDGFDIYNGVGTTEGLSTKWTQVNTLVAPSMVSGRLGGQAVRRTMDGNGFGYVYRPLPGNYASVAAGVAIRTNGLGTSPLFTFLDSAAGYQCGIGFTALGAVSAMRITGENAYTTLGSTANGLVTSGVWYYLEVEIGVHDTTGTFNIYLNGASTAALALTGQDTKASANANVGFVKLGSSSSTGYGYAEFDDLYIDDSGVRRGERRAELLYPTADVAQGWARSTGSVNYSLVDEAQVNGDTDYVQGSSVGDVDTYSFGDLSSNASTVDAVQLVGFGKKTDAGTREIYLQAKSGATTSDGSVHTLGSSYNKFERLMTLNPDGNVPWTYTSVNALQGGPKVAT